MWRFVDQTLRRNFSFLPFAFGPKYMPNGVSNETLLVIDTQEVHPIIRLGNLQNFALLVHDSINPCQLSNVYLRPPRPPRLGVAAAAASRCSPVAGHGFLKGVFGFTGGFILANDSQRTGLRHSAAASIRLSGRDDLVFYASVSRFSARPLYLPCICPTTHSTALRVPPGHLLGRTPRMGSVNS